MGGSAATPWSLHEILRATDVPFAVSPSQPLHDAAAAEHATAAASPESPPDQRRLRSGRCQVPNCTTPDEENRSYNLRCRCGPSLRRWPCALNACFPWLG
jgi:hypothetical protein